MFRTLEVCSYEKLLQTLLPRQQAILIRYITEQRARRDCIIKIDTKEALFNRSEWIDNSPGYKLWEYIILLIEQQNQDYIYLYIE